MHSRGLAPAGPHDLLTAATEEAAAVRERITMSKEASRIRQIISRLRSREDLAEIVEMAKSEVARAVDSGDTRRRDRGFAIYEAAREALGNASVRGQLPRHPQAA